MRTWASILREVVELTKISADTRIKTDSGKIRTFSSVNVQSYCLDGDPPYRQLQSQVRKYREMSK